MPTQLNQILPPGLPANTVSRSAERRRRWRREARGGSRGRGIEASPAWLWRGLGCLLGGGALLLVLAADLWQPLLPALIAAQLLLGWAWTWRPPRRPSLCVLGVLGCQLPVLFGAAMLLPPAIPLWPLPLAAALPAIGRLPWKWLLCLSSVGLIGLVSELVRQGNLGSSSISLAVVAAIAGALLLAAASQQQLARQSQLNRSDGGADPRRERFIRALEADLRAPLNGMLGGCELLLQAELPAHQQRLLRIIAGSVRSLSTGLDDLVALELSDRAAALRPVACDLQDIVDEAHQILHEQAALAGIRLDWLYPASLPRHFLVDADRLRQLLISMLQYVCRECRGPQLQTMVHILDPHADRPVLDLEIREVTATGAIQPSAGGGEAPPAPNELGNSLMQDLAERLGGELSRSSQSEICLRLLLALPKADRQHLVAATPPRQAHGRSALVIEDSPVDRQIAGGMLRRLGYTCSLCSDGESGLAALAAARFDIIFIDLHLPGHDGLQIARSIRARPGAHAACPIVAMTAHTDGDERAASLASGMQGFLSKPMRLADLAAVCDGLFARPRGDHQVDPLLADRGES